MLGLAVGAARENPWVLRESWEALMAIPGALRNQFTCLETGTEGEGL